MAGSDGTALNVSEKRALARHEKVIEDGLNWHHAAGVALRAIRDDQLYRAEYGDFDAYCRERWGFSQRRQQQLVRLVETQENLASLKRGSGRTSGSSHPPAELSERVVRKLAEIPTARQQADVLTAAEKVAPKGKDGNPKVTAKIVEEIARNKGVLPKPLKKKTKPKQGSVVTGDKAKEVPLFKKAEEAFGQLVRVIDDVERMRENRTKPVAAECRNMANKLLAILREYQKA